MLAELPDQKNKTKNPPQAFDVRLKTYLEHFCVITCLRVSNPQQEHGTENWQLITEQRFSAGINTCLPHQ